MEGVYDVAVAPLKLVDVDAHHEHLTVIASGGIAVVGKAIYEFACHSAACAPPPAGTGGSLPGGGATGEKIPVANIRAGDRFIADAKGALQAHYFHPGPPPSYPKWKNTDDYGERAVGVHTVISIEPIASRAMGSTSRGARIYDVHTDKGLLRYSSQAKLYRLHPESNQGHAPTRAVAGEKARAKDLQQGDVVGYGFNETPREVSHVTRAPKGEGGKYGAGSYLVHFKEDLPGTVNPARYGSNNKVKVLSTAAESGEAEFATEEFYNRNHRGGGPGGGQFTGPGGGGGSSVKFLKGRPAKRDPEFNQAGGGGGAKSRLSPTIGKAKVNKFGVLRKAGAKLKSALQSTTVRHATVAKPVKATAPKMATTDKKPVSKLVVHKPVTHGQDLMKKTFDENMTIEQVRAKIPKETLAAIAKATAEVKKLPATDKLVSEGGFKNPDGTYTKERRELHKKIVREAFNAKAVRGATPADGEELVALMTGGRPASGKTSMLREMKIDTSRFISINADEIQEKLPKYKGEHAALFHEEASEIANMIQREAVRRGLNVLFDGTMKTTAPFVDRVASLKAAGYNIDAHFMHVTPEVSAIRIAERFMGPSHRLVPIEIGFNSRTNEETFDTLIGLGVLRNWTLYDNNNPDRKVPPVLIASSDSKPKKAQSAHMGILFIEEFYNMVHSKADGKFAQSEGSGAVTPMAAPKAAAKVAGPTGRIAAKAAVIKMPKAPKVKAPAAAQTPMAPNRVGQRLLNKAAGGPGTTTLHMSEISKEGLKGMIGRLHEVGAVPKNLKTPDQVADFIAKNVMDVYNKVSPADRAAWKQWYPGANLLGKNMSGSAKQFSEADLGLSHQGANASIAVLSPGTHWNINVAQSRAAMKVLREDTSLTAKQAVTANKLVTETFGRQHAKWTKDTANARTALQELHAERSKTTDPKALKEVDDSIKEKQRQALKVEPTLDKLPNFVEGDRPSRMSNGNPASDYATGYMFRAVTPHPVVQDIKITKDGTYNDDSMMLNNNGKARAGSWQSYANLAKLTSVYRDSSIENISKQLGKAHKVRSFFNNINDPHNAAGDVTIDTHAYGIGLGKALSLSHPWISTSKGSKNLTGRPSSVPDGTSGTYAMLHEGFSRAAKQAGIEPREMQSVTWEAWRRMHTVAERAAIVKAIPKTKAKKKVAA